ncbi:MAG: lanthionine synthetase C family protein [Candidatus Sulfotelmatobacter sp.]
MTQWSPIFSPSDKLAIAASEAIDAITQSVIARDYESGREQTFPDRTYEPALLYGYLARAQNDLAWAVRATESLNQAIDKAAGQQSGYLGLYGGLAGLGWTVEHISHLLNQLSFPAEEDQTNGSVSEDETMVGESEADEDLIGEIDAVLLRGLDKFDSDCAYDLISGLVGFGVYFMERLPRESAVKGIEAVFNNLEKVAQHTSAGIAWHSGPELLPEWQREQCPNGYYNLGVAHGIPGIIHLLSEISVTSIVDQQRSRALLEGSVRWLISQQRPSGSRSTFSSWIVAGEESTDSRLAWCYGDMGILSVLLQVARRAGREDWHKFANQILDHCLAWPPDESGVKDAPLCHGAAGVAHIFNRLYHDQNDPRCLHAAVAWFERALAMRRPDSGVGGFSSLTRPVPSEPIVWEASPAFLDGAIGVALALLAATSAVEPGWDRMLLLSGRSG